MDLVKLGNVLYDPERKPDGIKLGVHSSVMIIPKEYKSYKEMKEKIFSPKAPKEIQAQIKLRYPHQEEPRVISEIISKQPKKETPLNAMFLEAAKGTKSFCIKVNVVEILPKDPRDWISFRSEKDGSTFTLNEVLIKGDENVPKGMKCYFKLKIAVKDAVDKNDGNMYLLHLCTIDGKGKEFFNMDLGDGKINELQFKELKRMAKMMLKPWNSLILGVEMVGTPDKEYFPFIVNTKLTP
jgi:hypothetical protein